MKSKDILQNDFRELPKLRELPELPALPVECVGWWLDSNTNKQPKIKFSPIDLINQKYQRKAKINTFLSEKIIPLKTELETQTDRYNKAVIEYNKGLTAAPLENKRSNAATCGAVSSLSSACAVQKNVVLPVDIKHKTERLRVYAAQRLAAKIAVSRVRICNNYPQTDKDVQVWETTNKRSSYKNLIHCSSVWTCPVCAAKIRNQRKNEVLEIMDGLKRDFYLFGFQTLTKKHYYTFNQKVVNQLVSDCNADFRKITANRTYKFLCQKYDIHYIKSLELTHGDNGYHPHLHIIFAFDLMSVDGVLNEKRNTALMLEFMAHVQKLWLKLSRGASADGQKYKVVYDADYLANLNNYVTKLNLAYEVTNPALKKVNSQGINPLNIPFMLVDMAADGVDITDLQRIYNVYEVATKGVRFMTFSKGLKERYMIAEISDAEACSNTKDLKNEEIGINIHVWRLIVEKGLRGVILNECEKVRENDGHYSLICGLIDKNVYLSDENIMRIQPTKMIYQNEN